MLKKLISDKFIKKMADAITTSLEGTLTDYTEKSELKIEKILTHVEALRLELKSLDERLSHKELKDRSEYGQVQYRINSLQNEIRQATTKTSHELSQKDAS